MIEAVQARQQTEINLLRSMTPDQLRGHIKTELSSIAKAEIPLQKIARLLIEEDAIFAIKTLPAKNVHFAIATFLAEGGALENEAVKWFAERVVDRRLLNLKRGRKSTLLYHHSIKRFIKILNSSLGYSVENAIRFVADATSKGDQHIRDIYYKKNKLSEN